MRSETTLGCAAADRAVVDGPEQSIPLLGDEFLEIRHRQTASARGAGAVLGRNALELPGDCVQARQTQCNNNRPSVKTPARSERDSNIAGIIGELAVASDHRGLRADL
jgi:hypothetical protein